MSQVVPVAERDFQIVTADHLDEMYRAPSGVGGWFSAVNHRQVGVRYIVTAFIFFLLGGLEALLLRIQLAQSNFEVLSPEVYNQIFTMHGTTMMFLFAVPIGLGFGNYLIPLMIGARDMPFRRLNAFGYWCFLFGGIFTYSSFLFGMAPDGGWFAYVPLTGPVHSPGANMDFWLLGISFVEISALLAAIEIIVAVVKTRAPGMSVDRIPLFVWSMIVTASMIVFAFPPLFAASVFLELDRKIGTQFFNPEAGGSELLWQHLFWIFGHPEVYIIFLPATGIVSMIIPTFTRRPIVGYALIALSTVSIAFLSFGVWVHHMFAVGLPLLALGLFASASIMIAVPSGIQMLAWIATIWTGRSVFKTPFLWIIGFLLLFLLGGITGVMVAVAPFDWQVHDSYFVVAHFHYVLVGGMLFPVFGGLYYWFPKMTGRMLSEGLGRFNFWTFFLGFNLAFFPMHILGLLGMPRRVYTYDNEMGWDMMNLLATAGTVLMAVSVLALLLNIGMSLRWGKMAGNNPWNAATLEWATESPPGNYNFFHLPQVSSRTPLRDKNGPNFPNSSGSYLGPLADDLVAPRRVTLGTTPISAHPSDLIALPYPSQLPIFLAFGVSVFFVGLLVNLVVPIVLGVVFSFVIIAFWLWPSTEHALTAESAEDVNAVHRATNWWAVLVAIGIGVTFYSSVVFAYLFLRLDALDWPPEGFTAPDLLLGAVATGVMLGGAGLAVWTGRSARGASNRGMQIVLMLSCAVSTTFLVLVGVDLWRQAVAYDTHAYGSAFYAMALSPVVWMVVVLFITAVLTARSWRGEPTTRLHAPQRSLAHVWIFATVVWLTSYGIAYVLPYAG